MADRDVQLIIRARNAASKAIDAVSDSLKELDANQKQVGNGAGKADSALGSLATEFSRLNKEAAGLAALSKVAGEMERAEKSVKGLQNETRRSAAEFATYARDAEKAAAAAAKLRSQVGRQEEALAREQAALKLSRSERTRANGELRKAETQYRKLQEAIAAQNKQGAPAARSASAFLSGDVAQARQAAKDRAAAFEAQNKATKATSDALKELNRQITATEAQHSKLSAAARESASSTNRNRQALTEGRAELAKIEGIAKQASTSLGGVSLSQDDLAASTKKVSKDLEVMRTRMDAMKRFSAGAGTFTDPKTADAIRRQREEMNLAHQQWKLLEGEVQRLAASMARVGPPTRQQSAAFTQLTGAARAAKNEYLTQVGALQRLEGAARGVVADVDRAGQSMRRTGQSARSMGADLESASNRGRGFRGMFGAFYGESRQAMSAMQRMRGEVLSLATAYGGLYGTIQNIGGVITAYQTLEAAQNRLGAVFDQNDLAVGRELQWIERQASRLGIQFGELGMQYSKFAVAARAANFEGESTRDIFLSVAEAGRVNKLSMDQLNGIFLALEQMISKGKVQSEELRRQLGDRLPGAFNIMANALGVTTAELDKMMQAGEVIADQETLTKFAEELNRRFGGQLAESLKSTTTLIGQFQNELFQAQLRVAKGGFIDALNEGLAELNEWFKSREGRDFFLSLGSALGSVVSILAKLPQHFDTLGVAIQAIVAYKFAQMLLGWFTNIQGTTLATASLSRTMTVLGRNVFVAYGHTGRFIAGLRATTLSAITLRGVLSSLAATMMRIPALAVFAGAAYLASELITSWVGGIDEATGSLDEHERVMGEVIAAYERVKGATDDWQKSIANVTIDQAALNFRRQLDQYNKALAEFGGNTKVKFSNGLSGQSMELFQLRNAVRENEMTMADFIKTVEEMYSTIDDPATKQFAEELLEGARSAQEVEERVRAAAVAAKEMGAESEGLDSIIKLLGGTMAELAAASEVSSDAMDDATAAAERYKAALEGIKGSIPSLADEMKRLKDIAKLDEFMDSLGMGPHSPEVMQYYNQARQEIDAQYIDTTPLINSLDHNSKELRAFYGEIKGSANLMSRNPSKWGDPGTQAWRETNLTTIETPGGMKAQVNKAAAAAFQGFINELEGVVGYEIKQFGGFNYRNKRGGSTLSEHAYGNAIDINWAENPMVKKLITDMPDQIGMIAAKYGLSWGGDWKSTKDAMHFEWTGREAPGTERATELELEHVKEITTERRKQAEERAKEQEALDKSISDSQFEIAQQALINDGKNREAAIEAAIREAKRQKKDITDEEIAKIAELTGKLYDMQNVQEGVKQAEAEVNQMLEMRQQLMQQIEFYQGQGEYAKAEQLKSQLEGVNSELEKAIDRAIEMWRAIGGPDADVAIAKLQTTKLGIKDLGDNSAITGKQINDMLTSGLINAMDQFAQAVANGEDVMKSLWRAFRQFAADFLIQIAKMILQKAIFNALGGATGGVGGFIAGLIRHDGGMVGAGGHQRAVAPGWFSNAVRYHEGGIAGLKSNEVPAILEKGEVVDPGDGSVFQKVFGNGQAPAPVVKVVNAFDSAQVISEGLNSPVGEEVFLNVVKGNASNIRSALGIA